MREMKIWGFILDSLTAIKIKLDIMNLIMNFSGGLISLHVILHLI